MYDWMVHNVEASQKGKDMPMIYILRTIRLFLGSYFECGKCYVVDRTFLDYMPL